MLYAAGVALAGFVAGAIASIAGFGIGSVLTPVLALRVGTRVAVAAISVPHFFGTAVRFWLLRGHVDRRTFLWFGMTSAAGGLIGALLHEAASNRGLSILFGCLLLFAGSSELTGFMHQVRLGRGAAWIAGAISGAFGGLVGNQGGIRSAALLAFDLDKETFVETATAIGLIVDAARVPVYLLTERRDLASILPLMIVAIVAVVAGTLFGSRALGRVPERGFRMIVAILLLALGVWMLVHG